MALHIRKPSENSLSDISIPWTDRDLSNGDLDKPVSKRSKSVGMFPNMILAYLQEHVDRDTFVSLTNLLLGVHTEPITYTQTAIRDVEFVIENTTNKVLEVDFAQMRPEVTKHEYISLADALKLEEDIYKSLQDRKRKARQAEANYWKLLDHEEVDS